MSKSTVCVLPTRRAVLGKDAHAARLAAALAASEARRMQLERTVRDMPRLRRGIVYALTAWCASVSNRCCCSCCCKDCCWLTSRAALCHGRPALGS